MRTGLAKKPVEGRETVNWYQFTTLPAPAKIKRHLKPFKGDVFGRPGGGFSDFEGGGENA
jgi:hypothetical protein